MKVAEYDLPAPQLEDGWTLDPETLTLKNGELVVHLTRVTSCRDAWALLEEAAAWIAKASPSPERDPLGELAGVLVQILPECSFPPGRLSPARLEALAMTAILRTRPKRRRPSQRFVEAGLPHLTGPVPEIREAGSSLAGANNVSARRSQRGLSWA